MSTKTVTAQSYTNIAFTKLSQWNTVFGVGEVGYPYMFSPYGVILHLLSTHTASHPRVVEKPALTARFDIQNRYPASAAIAARNGKPPGRGLPPTPRINLPIGSLQQDEKQAQEQRAYGQFTIEVKMRDNAHRQPILPSLPDLKGHFFLPPPHPHYPPQTYGAPQLNSGGQEYVAANITRYYSNFNTNTS